MDGNDVTGNSNSYGVHDWIDAYGNIGTELSCERSIQTRIAAVSGLFDIGHHASGKILLDCFKSTVLRSICIGIDGQLPQEKRSRIEAYFAWCKAESVIESYSIVPLVVCETSEKTWKGVCTIVAAAKNLGLKRRDLFFAIGSTAVTDIVGFAAATYRRSAPWVWVPTDPEGIKRCYDIHDKVSLHYTSRDDSEVGEQVTYLAFCHPPVASFYDIIDLEALQQRPDATDARSCASDGAFYEQTTVTDTCYHVSTVSGIFDSANTTLIRNYCASTTPGFKRKILIVVDDKVGAGAAADIESYFQTHGDSLEAFSIMTTPVASTEKDMDAVFDVIDASMKLELSPDDLMIVVGGGTLMDIVGFAAAMLKGGIPYIRIPTTLVGMIDAGIGAKVGVNFGNHKSLVGHYYAPVACLNDPEKFLATLPRREFVCGLAEAVKMALLASPRLFEAIINYHRTGGYNEHTDEVMYIAIRTMLEELQPNLYEHSLRRLVDFGHEFGHIVESHAHHEIPHGECVSMGMSISSHLACQKGILAEAELNEILDGLLGLGLPIYTTENDACNPDVLWNKISTDGTGSKDGMLWLAIPEAIGKGGFIDYITDINRDMIEKTVRDLRDHQTQYRSHVNGTGMQETANGNGAHSNGISDDLLSNALNGDHAVSNGNGHHGSGESQLNDATNRNQDSNGVSHLRGSRVPFKASIIGASGDIGLSLAQHLMQNNIGVLCSLRPASLSYFITRITPHMKPGTHILTGDLLNLRNLRTMIQESDVLYNMAGIVTLGSRSEEFASVIAVNGFAQGVIVHLVQKLGRQGDVKVIYPSTQRIHLTEGNAAVEAWVKKAATAFSTRLDDLLSEMNAAGAISGDEQLLASLERFSRHFLASHALPAGFNVYEVSKRLGEHFISTLPAGKGVSLRISGAYGPSFKRGFMHRTINPSRGADGGSAREVSEVRDFIFVDDLVEILGKAALKQAPGGGAFDVGSGERVDLKDVWQLARELVGDEASVVFTDSEPTIFEGANIKLNPIYARKLLGRDFTPLHIGMRRTTDALNKTHQPSVETSVLAIWEFQKSTNGFRFCGEKSTITEIVQDCLDRWFNRLPNPYHSLVEEHLDNSGGLSLRLRSDASMTDTSSFTVQKTPQDELRVYIDIRTDIVKSVDDPSTPAKLFSIIGREGHRLLAYLQRGCVPLLSEKAAKAEIAITAKWEDFLRPWERPYVIVIDLGATYMRVGVVGPHGGLIDEPFRASTPSKRSNPEATLSMVREQQLDVLVEQIDAIRARYPKFPMEEIGISLGAVVTREGIVHDASVLWGEPSRGFDFKKAVQHRLPGLRVTVLNDISAAAWRYKDEGRFCLLAVSSGLSNKVFDKEHYVLEGVDLDEAGVGGEMGHVTVDPRVVDDLVRRAMSRAVEQPDKFKTSILNGYVRGSVHSLTAHHLRQAVHEKDPFTLGLLDEVHVPYCACGNIADLCSYSSGRAALLYAKKLAASSGTVSPSEMTDSWLQEGIATNNPLAIQVLQHATYPLALRLLQLAADMGLDKFVVVGGFAMKTGKGAAYLTALQDHLVRFYHSSGYFSGWNEERVRRLVRLGRDDDNDGLLGMGYFVQNLRSHHRVVEKPVGETALQVVWRPVPRCGDRDVLTKVLYTGLCTTDMQLLRGERGQEPRVLGHEGVLEVLEVGMKIEGLVPGDKIVLNPNNPIDDHDKLGHNIEGIFSEYFKFGQEFIDRRQVLKLGGSPTSGSAVYTLVEPLSCVVAAQDRIGDRVAGKNVLVVGAGLMGLMFVTMCDKMGAKNVYMANRSSTRLDFAVARGIIPQGNIFVVQDDVASQIDQVSAGQGVDMVVICVSLGHGVKATKNAMGYINPGGCIYLFAGFSPGDMVEVDDGKEIDIWDVRSGWKTEPVKSNSKPLYLAGHRGSRREHLAGAANLVRRETASFNNLVSHLIGFDDIPGALLALARDGILEGVPAQRVVADMAAPGRLVMGRDM